MEEFWPTWWDCADAQVNSYSGMQCTQITPIAAADSVILPTKIWQTFVNYRKPNWLSWATVCVPDHNLLEGLDHPLKTWQSSSPFAAMGGWSSSWKTLVKKSGVLWTLKREQGRVSVFQSKEKLLNMKTRDHLQRWDFTYLNSLLSDFTHRNNYGHAYIYKTKKWCEVHTEQHMEDTKKMLTNTQILHAVCEGRSYISHCLTRLSKFPSSSSWSPELKITIQCKLVHIHWLAPIWGGPKNKPVM